MCGVLQSGHDWQLEPERVPYCQAGSRPATTARFMQVSSCEGTADTAPSQLLPRLSRDVIKFLGSEKGMSLHERIREAVHAGLLEDS